MSIFEPLIEGDDFAVNSCDEFFAEKAALLEMIATLIDCDDNAVFQVRKHGFQNMIHKAIRDIDELKQVVDIDRWQDLMDANIAMKTLSELVFDESSVPTNPSLSVAVDAMKTYLVHEKTKRQNAEKPPFRVM